MSERADAGKTGKYLYAVVPANADYAYGFSGINGSNVYAISNGRVAAVVSDVENKRIRPERSHLAAQQAVLKGLMAGEAVLPMTFGIIADSKKAVQRILARNQEAFLKQLRRVAGMVEMGLRVSWDSANIFEYFVNTHLELKLARDRLLDPGRNPSQEDKIEIGRLFERLLNADREIHTELVEQILSPYCREIKRNKCLQENRVMNLACLVASGDQVKFEDGVFEAAKLFDNNFAFDYNGPWAAHNFVELEFAV
ncbi:MAG: GvpL/GvpF family gas vesicle protein [Desulfovibrionaceae bacterium]|nr:GvpL/GvpF family gas vesicle protein [Desulfovibrionaceae bacterium]